MKKILLFLPLLIFVFSFSFVSAETYKIDSAHSNISFKIRHLVSNVKGSFSVFEGIIVYDDKDLSKSNVTAMISAASIDTNNSKRDEHLRNEDFFNVALYPEINFKSKRIEEGKRVVGDLTLHGVTKEVLMDVELTGVAEDPWGNTRVGFTASCLINRKDFGINYNKVLDQGNLLLGDDVSIEIEIEAILQT